MEPVPDRCAAAIVARGFDLHIHLLHRHQFRPDQGRNRDRVVNRRAGIADAAMEPIEKIQPFGNHLGNGIPQRADTFEILREHQRALGNVQPSHCNRHPAAKHDIRRLGINQDVKLRRRRPVAKLDAAAHEINMPDLGLQMRVEQHQRRDVGQRPGWNQHNGLFALLQNLRHQHAGVLRDRLILRLRQGGTVEAGVAVHRRRDDRVRDERLHPAHRERDIQPDERHDASRVIGRFLDGLVAANGCYGLDVEHGTRVCQYPRDCVVVPRIAVQNHRYLFIHAFTSGLDARIFFTRLMVLAA
ncbi:hypothetical protein SDC9_76324 [bioreactor metagenome]|uniref:Uncharacterized protein n=1 Tax=bioreactor metagenome TaxID=1076179 RepID=A0A644YTI3_9ZZZZ